MNTNAESRSLPPSEPPGFQRVLVWDAPLRVFHWLMAGCFAGAWLAAGQEGWRNIHQTLGYTWAAWWSHAWWKALHEGAALAMLVLVGLHIAGVTFGSWRAGENLARSMIGGTKLGAPGEAIRSAWHSVALLMSAAAAGFWGYQWTGAATVAASREQLREESREQPVSTTEARREPGDNG